MNYHTKYFNKLEKAVAFAEAAMYQVKEVHFSVRNDTVGREKVSSRSQSIRRAGTRQKKLLEKLIIDYLRRCKNVKRL